MERSTTVRMFIVPSMMRPLALVQRVTGLLLALWVLTCTRILCMIIFFFDFIIGALGQFSVVCLSAVMRV